MNELIKVTYSAGEPTVSARDLHERLEIKTAFKDWFPRMIEYGFEAGKDFNMLKNERVQMEGNREVRREITDYQISVDMAKQICMIQRNEKSTVSISWNWKKHGTHRSRYLPERCEWPIRLLIV